MDNRIYDRHVLAGFGVVVKRPIPWGQSPGLSDVLQSAVDQNSLYILGKEFAKPDPVMGWLKPGDRIRLLYAQLPDDGVTRVEVRPVDGRKVGNSQNQVWIHWPRDGRRVRGLFRIEEATP